MWKWRDEATVLSELGDPTNATSYSICVYESGGGLVAAAAAVAAGGSCDSGDCWAASSSGYRFKDKPALQDGIRAMSLKASDTPGSASVKVQGSGAQLLFTSLPLSPSLRVQLVRDDSALCWESLHDLSAIQLNTDQIVRSKTP